MPSPTILVVEDDPVILRLLEVNFDMEGYAVLTASDGEQGLALARQQDPDLIVSDIMMPRVSGLDMVAALRADPRTAEIPVILLSAKAQTGDVAAGAAVGADDYVTKPFEPMDLIERVEALLQRR